MKTPTTLLLVAIALLSAADIATAGGPLGGSGTTPRRYQSSDFPLSYKIDLGGLGAFSNSTATGIVDYAFDQWDSVLSSSLSFTNAGSLSRNVTSASDSYISGSSQYSDGVNPVVFDSSGAITDSRIGSGAHNSILGFASSAYNSSNNRYIEGYAIINGALTGSGSSTYQYRYKATITHETGHMLGLSHSQTTIGGELATMYPGILDPVGQATLSPDDTAAMAVLYPTSSFTNSVGSITGTVRTAQDSNLSDVNVIAVDSATGAAYSTVVDYFSGSQGTFFNTPSPTGTYTIKGLPPGTYYVRIEPIGEIFTGGSSVASYPTPLHSDVRREWYNGSNESGDLLSDDQNAVTGVSVSAGQTTSNVDLVSSTSSTLSTITGFSAYNRTFSLPSGSVTKYATRFVAPSNGSLLGMNFFVRYTSDLPSNGSVTISVHSNTSGSLAGVPGSVLGSVTIPYSRLAVDDINEVWLRGIGSNINFNQGDTFHISITTNGVGTLVIYGDNGQTATHGSSYYTSSNGWKNFPDGLSNGTPSYNIGIQAVYSTESAGSASPAVSLSPSSVNFGRVRANSSKLDTLTLRNSGSATLSVSSTSLRGTDSLDYQIVSGGGSYTLAAGSSRSIVVRFRPRTGAPAGQSGLKQASLRLVSDASSSPNDVSLSGNGVLPVATESVQTISLGQVRTGTADTVTTAIIHNTGNDTLRISGLSLSGTDANSGIRIVGSTGAFNLRPDSTYRVRMAFAPTTRKNYSASLSVSHDDTAGSSSFSVAGVGIAPVASIGVDTIDFGRVDVGSTSDADPFYLHNVGDAPLVIDSITVPQGDVQAFALTSPSGLPATVQPGDSIALRTRFQASERKHYGATLRISHDANGSPNDIALVGEGVAPLLVSGTVHDVGSIRVGRALDDPAPLVIRNAGSAPLEITQLTLDGNQAAEFAIDAGSLPRSVQPGDSLSVGFTFQPQGRGQRVTTLKISSNDPESPTTSVLISGTGLQGELALGVGSLNFGEVLVNESADLEVNVINQGTDTARVMTAEATGDGFSVVAPTPSGVAVEPGGSMTITVRFAPAATGNVSGTLRVTSDVSSDALVVPLAGRGVLPGLAVGRTAIDFGAVRLSQSAVDSATVRNTGNATLTGVQLALGGGSTSAFEIVSPSGSFDLAAGAERTIVVRLKPQSAVGPVTDQIDVTADGGLSTSIALEATAVEGAVSVVADVDFGSTIPGGTHDTTVAVTNTGTAPLRITEITTLGDVNGNAGSFFLALTGVPVTIQPGASMDLAIRWLPTGGPGEYTGSLTVKTDSGLDSTITITLHGVVNAVSGVTGLGSSATLGAVQIATVVPNPARGLVETNFTLPARGSTPVTLQLVDVSGRVVATVFDESVAGAGPHRVTFDVAGLPSGRYQLVLRSSVGMAVQPLVVVR